jgi:hypothetical protein
MTPENSLAADGAGERSVVLIRKLNAGDSTALEQLYLKYHAILAQRVSGKLRGRLAPLREDVVISTFRSFQRRFQAGHFTSLEECNDLLGLLTCIAVRKAINAFNREVKSPRESPAVFIAETRDADPVAEAATRDLVETYVGRLSPDLREFATLHLDGHTNREIAELRTTAGQPCVERTVERKIARIKAEWRAIAETVLQEAA